MRLAGDAPEIRNAGGQVIDAVINDIAFISYAAGTMIPDGPPFEVAVVPHTGCGTRFPPTPHSGPPFSHATGLDKAVLATKAAADPAATVRADVKQLLSSPRVPP